jgi:hypothetical protein
MIVRSAPVSTRRVKAMPFTMARAWIGADDDRGTERASPDVAAFGREFSSPAPARKGSGMVSRSVV